MGYFLQKRSRQRCAAVADQAVRRQSTALRSGCALTFASASSATTADSYLRFAVGSIDPRSCTYGGLFQACYGLRRRRPEDFPDGQPLSHTLAWFEDNLS